MNKFCDNCLHYSVCEKEGKDDSAMVFCDDCLHLNNFIPIEWIRNWLNNCTPDENCVENLLFEWGCEEKENE